MRIWHYDIIKGLPAPLLSALHMDCCRIRGKGWGKATTPKVKWLWQYTQASIEWYHLLVMEAMEAKGWNPNPLWKESGYRGKRLPRVPKEWERLPLDWPAGCLFSEFTPGYLEMNQQDLLKWYQEHPKYLGS